MAFDAEKFARRVPQPSRPQPSTLEHLRTLVEQADGAWIHWSECYYDDDAPKGDAYPNDYRGSVWGGSDVLYAGEGHCEDLGYYEMAFAAGAALAMPLLLDLYEAVLKAQPHTTNESDPVRIALAHLANFCRPLPEGSVGIVESADRAGIPSSSEPPTP